MGVVGDGNDNGEAAEVGGLRVQFLTRDAVSVAEPRHSAAGGAAAELVDDDRDPGLVAAAADRELPARGAEGDDSGVVEQHHVPRCWKPPGGPCAHRLSRRSSSTPQIDDVVGGRSTRPDVKVGDVVGDHQLSGEAVARGLFQGVSIDTRLDEGVDELAGGLLQMVPQLVVGSECLPPEAG